MFKFLLGVLSGSAGLYYYSENVRINTQLANRELKELISNRRELRNYVIRTIKRMQASGELDKILYNGYSSTYNKIIFDDMNT